MMVTWAPGMACLVHGDWPAHVLVVDAPRLRAAVRFLGGDAPDGLRPEATVALGALVRPRLPANLDRPALRHWVTKPNPWTGADLRRLRAGLETRPLAAVAADLGRSETACHIALYRWWGTKAPRTDRRMSSRRVARILGVDDHRITRLIAEGALVATGSGVGAGKNERWCVTADALDDFLDAHPERYDWRQVEPGRWRDRAQAINQADPLLTVAEAGRRLGLCVEVVRRRIREGRLPAVWSDGGKAGSARRWLVRSSVVAAVLADLDGWLARRMAA